VTAATGGPAGTGGPTAAVCFACGEPVGASDSFCESCGTELAPLSISDGHGGDPVACESCASSRISADGYCESCGRKARSGRDHQEVDLGIVAGVTDRGLRHHRNEDATDEPRREPERRRLGVGEEHLVTVRTRASRRKVAARVVTASPHRRRRCAGTSPRAVASATWNVRYG